MQLAHANQAQVGEVGAAVFESYGQFTQRGQLGCAVKSDFEQSIFNQFQNAAAGTQVKACFGQHRLTSEKRFGDLLGQVGRPPVMTVCAVPESHNEASIGNALHRREYPFREERSAGPEMVPACRMKRCLPCCCRAVSNRSRMSFPTGTPVAREVSFSQAIISSGRRTVSVLLIWHYCNTG
jgi:hypothetical protein